MDAAKMNVIDLRLQEVALEVLGLGVIEPLFLVTFVQYLDSHQVLNAILQLSQNAVALLNLHRADDLYSRRQK
jgi:hypothetical protein